MLQEQLLRELLRELDDPKTDHQRRCAIGDILSQVGDPRPGVGLREDGIPDIVWLPVAPGGTLKIEQETHNVSPFYIAKYLITYTQYEAFVQAKDGFDNPEWWHDFPKEYQKQKLVKQRTKFWSNPRDRVSWYQAVAFTRWLNYRLQGLQLTVFGSTPLVVGQNAEVRLPVEWEWQWAAQNGEEARTYPWGEWKEGYTNTLEAGLGQTTAVGMYPHGAAVCEALDMSGNLWEWCWNKNSAAYPYPVLRGGSFDFNSHAASRVVRYLDYPNLGYDYYGVRVVVSIPIVPSLIYHRE